MAIGLVVLILLGLYTGLAGHIIHWFDGDLQYHRAVAFSMRGGDLNGQGPYTGLPSYFGGIFPLLWAAAIRIGLPPDPTLSVVSWFEPFLWAGAAWFLAGSLWQKRSTRTIFVALVLVSGGFDLASGGVWVESVNLSGQALWPLYPRDMALVLLMTSAGLALRNRKLWSAVAAAATMSIHPQIGLIAFVWIGVVVWASGRSFRDLGLWTGAALLLSSWYWMPRVLWVWRWGGLTLSNSELRSPFDLTPTTVAAAYGLILLPSLWVLVHKTPSKPRRLALLWLAILIGIALATQVLGSAILPTRRVLLIASLPLLLLATEGFHRALQSTRLRRIGISGLIIVMVAGIPALRSGRSVAAGDWTNDRYARLDYPATQWAPVWATLRQSIRRPVLVAEGDAAPLWFETGAQPLWMKRPGFVKVGFDVGDVTGWTEAAREGAVTHAFEQGLPGLCSLAAARNVSTMVLRSRPHLLGTLDWVPASSYRLGELSGVGYVDVNKYAYVRVSPFQKLRIPFVPTASHIDIWIIPPAGSNVALLADGAVLLPDTTERDGSTYVYSFTMPTSYSKLELASTESVRVLRVVGYQEGPGSLSGPETVLSVSEICKPGAEAGR